MPVELLLPHQSIFRKWEELSSGGIRRRPDCISSWESIEKRVQTTILEEAVKNGTAITQGYSRARVKVPCLLNPPHFQSQEDCWRGKFTRRSVVRHKGQNWSNYQIISLSPLATSLSTGRSLGEQIEDNTL